MPQEKRKRGGRGKRKKETGEQEELKVKKVKADHERDAVLADSATFVPLQFSSDGQDLNRAERGSEAPFGYLDGALKSYLKTLEPKFIEAHEQRSSEISREEDPARLLLEAVLTEVRGQELVIATDPDGSVIIQRIFNLLDERQSRIFADTLVGSVFGLARHRFGSHVLQDVLKYIGHASSQPNNRNGDAETADVGRLRSAQELAEVLYQEVVDQAALLVSEQFGTHVLRTIVTSLMPSSFNLGSSDSSAAERSLKSKTFVKSSGIKEKTNGLDAINEVPPWKRGVLRDLVCHLQLQSTPAETLAWISHASASVTLQYLLEAESYLLESGEISSPIILARVFDETLELSNPSEGMRHSAIVEGLIRDPVGSRTLQVALRKIKTIPGALQSFSSIYLKTRLLKLACHPVAFYIVNEILGLLDPTLLDLWDMIWQELRVSLVRLVKSGKPSVLRAIIHASIACGLSAAKYDELKSSIIELFGQSESDPELSWNLVTLTLRSPKQTTSEVSSKEEQSRANEEERSPSIHGSLLFQALLGLPNIETLASNFASLNASVLQTFAMDAKSSHIFDVLFTTPTIPKTTCRQCILSLAPAWPTLARHNIGSRVLEKMWAAADIALCERIARKLTEKQGRQAAVIGSLESDFYGKKVWRNFGLSTFQRRIGEWREMQIEIRRTQKHGKHQGALNVKQDIDRVRAPSEIDELFRHVPKRAKRNAV